MPPTSYIVTALSAFFTGGGIVKFLVYVSKNMPPLPSNAGWWKTFGYSLLKGLSGLDPSATIISPPSVGKS
jgi:hypothetical protein